MRPLPAPKCAECGTAPGVWAFILHIDGTLDTLCHACDTAMVNAGFRWPKALRPDDLLPRVRPLSELRQEWKDKYGDAHDI